ncbi:hypothetical protein LMG29542_02230 [Paraburkholderia humisilvae]|uniref:Integral membrane protein TerC n=1 Tax=Paraburkholderia humisilvae TaxID=627669 RepID=A0A6J5DKQ6_9BURK|nr:hypothetical protein LMG29542_02230 [Paraburkholderia humisilvae]
MTNTTAFLGYFTLVNWAVIAQIALLDLTLSANNAAVAAPSCAALPSPQRRQAMMLGGAAAIALRAALLAILRHVIGLPYIRAIGGAYLCFAGYQLLTQTSAMPANGTGFTSIGSAIRAIALGDVLMSIDNVLAISAITRQLPHNGIAYGVAGVCLSIPVVMFGASLMATVIERLPVVMWIGAGLLGWVGVDLALSEQHLESFRYLSDVPIAGREVPVAQIVGFCAVVLVARIANRRAARSRALNLN